jgi:hypothetical protein
MIVDGCRFGEQGIERDERRNAGKDRQQNEKYDARSDCHHSISIYF